MPAQNIAVIEPEKLSGKYDKRYVVVDAAAFDCAKCGEPFNAALVRQMLKENNLDSDFTAGELLQVWETSLWAAKSPRVSLGALL